ncbi:response regulator [Hymenobacter sp. ASUV-10]|uniref:Response regulator n=1 Tax=Hymenobacter aranciens TaxID=3063996 RepID=A0ABT9B9S9_9BACT|nr:response regulator [Hymenobacter sp. ASUV-10]MDO7874418.1 response regulator [Hymenobacter sp. ASUV-10]
MDPKITIVVVEDEALIARNLRLTLEDLGYEVLATCFSYAKAREALATLQPDVVLLDINLGSDNPAHNGLALAQLLREQPEGPPFIFLTAYDDLDTIRQATRLQPSGYLIKPVNGAALFGALQSAIESHRRQVPAPPPERDAPAPATPDFFYVKTGGHVQRLLWREIASLEAGKNYVTLRTGTEPRRSYAIRGSLAYVLEQLVPEGLRGQFLRISRGVYLNPEYITGHDEAFVYCGPERFENGHTAQRQLGELGR